MKARLLRKLLNNTEYSVSNHREYIAVGSPLCHDLINLNKQTLKVKYELDTYREGRKCLEKKSNSNEENELLFIWDKLTELVETGQIHDIINGKDEIENPLPVFTVVEGNLIESITDAYGWPNTDDNGICMHNNTHFPTAEQAIAYGIKEYKAGESMALSRIGELKDKLAETRKKLAKYRSYIEHFVGMQNKPGADLIGEVAFYCAVRKGDKCKEQCPTCKATGYKK